MQLNSSLFCKKASINKMDYIINCQMFKSPMLIFRFREKFFFHSCRITESSVIDVDRPFFLAIADGHSWKRSFVAMTIRRFTLGKITFISMLFEMTIGLHPLPFPWQVLLERIVAVHILSDKNNLYVWTFFALKE